MSQFYELFVQRRSDDGWRALEPFDPISDPAWPRHGHLATFPFGSLVVEHFFFGRSPLFPLRREEPEGLQETEIGVLCQDNFVGWLPFADLLVDGWADVSIFVSVFVDSRFAPLFGAGDAPFPEEALLQAGFPPDELRWLKPGHGSKDQALKPVLASRFTVVDRPLQTWHVQPLDQPVPVSFRVTLVELVDPRMVAGLLHVRSLAAERDLRVVVAWAG